MIEILENVKIECVEDKKVLRLSWMDCVWFIGFKGNILGIIGNEIFKNLNY